MIRPVARYVPTTLMILFSFEWKRYIVGVGASFRLFKRFSSYIYILIKVSKRGYFLSNNFIFSTQGLVVFTNLTDLFRPLHSVLVLRSKLFDTYDSYCRKSLGVIWGRLHKLPKESFIFKTCWIVSWVIWPLLLSKSINYTYFCIYLDRNAFSR